MGQANRPLSPHLDVYGWKVTNTLSILHRATGVVLATGALVLTAWLVALASGPDAYLGVLALLDSPPGILLLFGWSFCFFYHLCNGIRHLCWDAGFGFEMPRVRASGTAVVAGSVVLTLLFWLVVLTSGGSGS
jgi:succinate dehydrogenase / fumarate reductase, cytochrome b subunit